MIDTPMLRAFACATLAGMVACSPAPPTPAAPAATLADKSTAQAYAQIGLTGPDLRVRPPTGTSPVADGVVSAVGDAAYAPASQAWSLGREGAGFEVAFALDQITLVQLVLRVPQGQTAAPQSTLTLDVNGTTYASAKPDITGHGWQAAVFDIASTALRIGGNTLRVTLAGAGGQPLLVDDIKLIPRQLYATDGVLSTTLYAQFGTTNSISAAVDPAKKRLVWTRAYGLASTTQMLPGPILHYRPGDLLQVNLINRLDPQVLDTLTSLGEFENDEAFDLNQNSDETLDNLADQIREEVNIPHNLNNTNLHVHGLHVDPAKDDVTIVIVPETEAGTVAEYDAPHHVPNTPSDLDQLNEGSVADQAVKPGDWLYEYRLPANHLPGTHWFHPHKHGSTAAQVENGMAGAMVIEELPHLELFPGEAGTEWSARYDQVMIIQQIANYGLQQGQGGGGGGGGGASTSQAPVTVINGEHRPAMSLAPGQIVRWRFVNAGANHQAFNHLWMGMDTGKTDGAGQPVYVSYPLHAVAFDGITVNSKVTVGADSPLLLAPGNRTDLLLEAPAAASGPLTLFKYYPTSISIVAAGFDYENSTPAQLQEHLIWDCAGVAQQQASACTHGSAVPPLRPAFAPASNPYLLAPLSLAVPSGASGFAANFAGFNELWSFPAPTGPSSTGLTPLIKVRSGDTPGRLALSFALADSWPTQGTCANAQQCTGKWQPVLDGLGGGGIKAEALLDVHVDATIAHTGPTALPEDSHLSAISPSGTFASGRQAEGFAAGVPPYVSAIDDGAILQSRPVIFDKSGAAIQVTGDGTGSKGTAKVNQFTLNGRPFALNDMIGNSTSKVDARLGNGVTLSELKRVDTGDANPQPAAPGQCTPTATTSCLDIAETLAFEGSGNGAWSNSVCVVDGRAADNCTDDGANGTPETTYYWANPGYFQPIQYDQSTQAYSYAADALTPDWRTLSGLSAPALVNPNASYGDISGNVNGLPGLPIATTAEEWVLINNSDIGHPFHIHINPFFVTEVGQLSYETFADGANQWLIRAVSTQSLPAITSVQSKAVSGSPAPVSAAPSSPGVYATTNDVPNFVGNWWDTVIVPPHGYVRVRYWFNVPDQTGEGPQTRVVDNSNKIGVWVYHCHILRHEDRGMMMPVITQAREPAAGAQR